MSNISDNGGKISSSWIQKIVDKVKALLMADMQGYEQENTVVSLLFSFLISA